MKKETYILLDTLSLKNFKGIFDQTFRLDGASKNIFGANEAGKTTFLTALLWLLTGKDEYDRQDYEIKNTAKPELNRQGHEVEGIFRRDEQTMTLKRVYKEKWVKPRGSSQEVFEGHETLFFVNDVPCKTAAEYKTRVDELIPTHLLKILTNPMYFNSLKWDEQRRGLMQIAGEVTNDEIFQAISTPKNDYGTLIMVLNSGKYKTIDDFKAEVSAKISKLKKSAVEYKPRIDEASRNKPETKNWSKIEKDIAAKTKEYEDIDRRLSDALEASKVKYKGLTDKRSLLFEKESALADIRNKIRTRLETDRSQVPNQIASLKRQVSDVNISIDGSEKKIANVKANITAYHTEIARLDGIIAEHRTNWIAINGETFSFNADACECPTCKQKLPNEKVEEQRESLLKNFNKSVADRKAREVAQSDQRKAERKQQLDLIAASTEHIHQLERQLADLQSQQETLNSQVDALLKEQNSKSNDPLEVAVDALMKVNADALNLQDEIAALKAEIEIESNAAATDDDQTELKAKRTTLSTEIASLRDELALRKVIEDTDKRIQQLQDEEQAIAQDIADLERQEFEIETYTRAKMDIIQQRVNSKFRLVQFRLFEKQVNGQIVESCVCEYKGVPYPTLNTAAKLQAGLDVLETFSNYYGIHAPVVVDNKESVTYLPETKSQLICLIVSPEDNVLRMEDVKQMKKAS